MMTPVGVVVVVVDAMVVDVVEVDEVEVEDVDDVEVDDVEDVDEVDDEDVDEVDEVQAIGAVVVVVGQFGRVSAPKRTTPMARSPAWSPMATTHESPAVIWAALGGHWNLLASARPSAAVFPLPVRVQPGMAVPPGLQVSTCELEMLRGGPTFPVLSVCVVLRLPPESMCVRASGEQLIGMLLPRNTVTGWLGSLLHWMAEAWDPAVKFAPERVITSPAFRLLHHGAEATVLLQVAAVSVVVMLRVGPLVKAPDSTAAVNNRPIPTNRAPRPVITRR